MIKTILRFLILAMLLTSCSYARINTTPIIPTQTPTSTSTPIPTVTLTPIPIGIKEIANLGKGSADLVEWSPDGKFYIIGGSLGIRIYDANSHNEVKYIPKEFVNNVWFSPDGQLIGVRSSKYLTIIRLSDEKVLFEIESTQLSEMAFSTDSRLFAYVLGCWQNECSDTIIVHDYSAQKDILKLNIQTDSELVFLNKIAFNSDNTLLAAAGSNGLIYVWDISTGKLIVTLKGHKKSVIDLQFSPNSSDLLASSSYDGTVQLWDIKQNKTTKILSGFQSEFEKIIFSSDGSTLEVFTDSLVQTFDTISWKKLSSEKYTDADSLLLQELRSNGGYIEFTGGFAYSPDGQTLAVGSSASSPVLLWDITTKQIKATIETEASRLVYSHQGLLLTSVDDDGNISVWDANNYAQLQTTKISPVDSIVFSPDDLNIAVSSEGKILIWNIQQDKIVQIINTGSEKAILLTYDPNGDAISAVDENSFSIKSWNTSTGEVVHSFTPPENLDYRQVVNLSNDVLAIFKQTGIQNNVIELWDIVSGEKSQEFKGINDYVYPRLAYSPNRKVVAISYFYGITFYCSNTGKPIYVYDEEVNWVKFSFSPDGNYLAIGDSRGNIRLWDVSRIVQESSCENP